MLKKCKWCHREFCPGERCKNAWKYAKRTGKLEKGNRVNIPLPPSQIERPAYLNGKSARNIAKFKNLEKIGKKEGIGGGINSLQPCDPGNHDGSHAQN